MLAEVVHRTAGFQHLQRLVAIWTQGDVSEMMFTAGAVKTGLIVSESLLTGWAGKIHQLSSALWMAVAMNGDPTRYRFIKKGPCWALLILTLVLLQMRHQTLTFTLLCWRQQIAFARVRVIALFELNANRRTHHVE